MISPVDAILNKMVQLIVDLMLHEKEGALDGDLNVGFEWAP